MIEYVEPAADDTEELRHCPWCRSADIEQKKRFAHLGIALCRYCNLCFTNPRVREDRIATYYGSEYLAQHSDASVGDAFDVVYRDELALLQRLSGGSKLLEIGCGGGRFSILAKRSGFDVTAQDVSEDLAKSLRVEDINFVSGSLADIELPDHHFDVIVAHHVFEHVYDIDGFLTTVSKLLNQSGIAVLTLPNIFSIDAKLKAESYRRLVSLPFHNYHFTPRVFESIARKAGFTVAYREHTQNFIVAGLFRTIRRVLAARETTQETGDPSGATMQEQAEVRHWPSPKLSQRLANLVPGEQLMFHLVKESSIQ